VYIAGVTIGSLYCGGRENNENCVMFFINPLNIIAFYGIKTAFPLPQPLIGIELGRDRARKSLGGKFQR